MSHHFLEIEHNNTEFLTRHIEQLNDIKKRATILHSNLKTVGFLKFRILCCDLCLSLILSIYLRMEFSFFIPVWIMCLSSYFDFEKCPNTVKLCDKRWQRQNTTRALK